MKLTLIGMLDFPDGMVLTFTDSYMDTEFVYHYN